MNKKEKKIYTFKVDEIKKTFALHSRKNAVFIILQFCMISYFVYYLYYLKYDDSNYFITIFMPLIFVLFNLYRGYYRILTKKILLSEYKSDYLGKHKKDDIEKLFEETLATTKENKEEVPKIYLTFAYQASASAFAVDLLALNFIKSLNAIYIPLKYFYILNKKELQCVVAHELAHFRFYMALSSRVIYILYLFTSLLTAFILVYFKLDDQWYNYLLFIIIYNIIFYLLGFIYSFDLKNNEYLSDYYAAVKYGKLNTINMLLTIGRYSESLLFIYKSILKYINGNEKLVFKNFQPILEIVKRSLPKELTTKRKLGYLLKKIYESEEVINLEKNHDKKELQKSKEAIEKYRIQVFGNWKYKTINWDLFDFNEKDWKINKSEYPHLIKALVNNPEGQLFDSLYDNINYQKYALHPTMRKRILFLHDNIEEL